MVERAVPFGRVAESRLKSAYSARRREVSRAVTCGTDHGVQVGSDEPAITLDQMAVDEDGFDVAGMGGRHHRTNRIVQASHVQGVRAQDDDVRALAGAQRPDDV